MKDLIKKALTKRTRRGEIPPNDALVYGVKFAVAITACLSALEIVHMMVLNRWNSEIFSAITALTGTITGIFITQKT